MMSRTAASSGSIAALKNLKQIDLYHTLFTEEAIRQLKTVLPDCRIYWQRDSNKRERRS